MDSPRKIASSQEPLSPCTSSGRRRSSDSNSPEFEFWRVPNPSFPEPNILSADELFVDGVLLPLHLLHLHNHNHDPGPQPDPEPPNSQSEKPGPQISHKSIAAESVGTPLTASKRWKDIFKKGENKATSSKNQRDKDNDREKKKEKKNQSGATSSSAELNINIWPFSRSRSAGNSGARPTMFPGTTRKVSSAPCSRSNSAGESKSRKWPSSPGRAHLGRSSPVWQARRGSGGSRTKTSNTEAPVSRSSEKMASKKKVSVSGGEHRRNKTTIGDNSKRKVVNLNVPMCMAYRQHLSCRSDENSATGISNTTSTSITITATAIAEATIVDSSNSISSTASNLATGGGNLFNLRSLFTKKVY
ncbi:uncharacterized protein LOC8277965 [Ricinus communis]|uniref:Uncharacterized protein n=1 Tax=Ricinus communis TaxID=3988 RepID=B9RXE8_RICCO|nr:uncharacterized protein LOC8277965 [Ricinus communis]EEF43804.1 conserved hypothetical protein [Ricinus communis]|eukprot:XP_002518417.1 uncharacterized protein LOC8277965 [Ricinus communis]